MMTSAGSTQAAAFDPPAPGPPRRSLLLLVFAVALCGTILYFPTFGASFAYDDIDYLNQAADVLAGKVSYWKHLIRPQGEHFVAGVRIVIHASALLFGANALPFRLFIFLNHLASAFLLALVTRRYLPNSWPQLATGLAYIASCGFSSMWVWFPSGGSVILGLTGVMGALAAIAHQNRIGRTRARLLAAGGVLFAVFCENTLAPLLTGPMLMDEYERRARGRRGVGLFTVFSVVVIISSIVLTSLFYRTLTGNQIALHPEPAIKRTLFLLLLAPFRYFFPGVFLPRPLGVQEWFPFVGGFFGLAVALAAAALFVAVFRPESRPLTTVAALMIPGSIGVLGLVGLGRWDVPYDQLYDGDRYFFTLLIPIALFAGALAHGIRQCVREWPRTKKLAFGTLIFAFSLTELHLHRFALLRRIPFGVYAAHAKRYQELSALARLLTGAARALPASTPPLEFPDSAFSFEDVHLHRISSRFLLHIANRDKTARLKLGGPRVTERDQKILNPVLERWAAEIGQPLPYVSIVDGYLFSAREVGHADFRIRPHESKVVGGFYDWEQIGRWMKKRGELRLVMTSDSLSLILSTPWREIQKRHPDWTALNLRATLIEEGTAKSAEPGTLTITSSDIETYHLRVPEPFASSLRGRSVYLILESDRTWRPVDVLPGSLDERVLSVLVYSAGFDE